jgi:predicted nucleic acid-binding Zn ribbon protein
VSDEPGPAEDADAGHVERVPEHIAVYQRIRRVFGDPALRSGDARRRKRASRDESSVPYGVGRDPRGIADVMDNLTSTMGWDSPLARADLLASWSEIVGDETAAHTAPIGIEEGVLTVRCDSTAWATQLRRMNASVTTKILTKHAAAGIESVRFLGPDAPSWKRGPRAIPGRGPRDTYG